MSAIAPENCINQTAGSPCGAGTDRLRAHRDACCPELTPSRGQSWPHVRVGWPASTGQMTAYADLVRKLALLLLIAITVLSVIVGGIWLVHRPSEVEKAVLSAAEAGAFPPPNAFLVPRSNPYDGQIECRVEVEEAFQGQDLYLCKLGVKGLDNGAEYIYAVMVGGKLHTHQTDPAEIPAKVFDPSF